MIIFNDFEAVCLGLIARTKNKILLNKLSGPALLVGQELLEPSDCDPDIKGIADSIREWAAKSVTSKLNTI